MIRIVVYPYLPSDPKTKWIVAYAAKPQAPLFEGSQNQAIQWALAWAAKQTDNVITDVKKP